MIAPGALKSVKIPNYSAESNHSVLLVWPNDFEEATVGSYGSVGRSKKNALQNNRFRARHKSREKKDKNLSRGKHKMRVRQYGYLYWNRWIRFVFRYLYLYFSALSTRSPTVQHIHNLFPSTFCNRRGITLIEHQWGEVKRRRRGLVRPGPDRVDGDNTVKRCCNH